jgi:hypothetical protein
MVKIFVTWNVRSLCRSGSLEENRKKITKVCVRSTGSTGDKMEKAGTEPTYFCTEIGMLIVM